MSAVQVIGKEQTLEFYDAYGIDTWALFQNKRICIAGGGRDDLSQWLDRLYPAGSTGTYHIRLYENVEPAEVNERTEYRYCYNAKLVDSYGGMGMIGGYTAMLEQQIAELKKKLEDQEDDDDDDLGQIIMGYLKNPEQLGQVIGMINMFRGGANTFQPAATMGATNKPDIDMNNEQKIEELGATLDRLEKADPKIVEHLTKLAELAEKKPNLFKMLLMQLDGI